MYICCGSYPLSMDGFPSLQQANINRDSMHHSTSTYESRQNTCRWDEGRKVCITIYRDKQCLSSKRLKLCRCNGKQSHSTSTSCFVVFALKVSSSHSDNVAASLLPKCLEFILEQGLRPRLSATKELYSSAVQLSCCAFSFDDVHLTIL